MKKNLVNEYDLLESVIVHTPGIEMFHMMPENLDPEDKENYLLFDDIIFPETAINEHQILCRVIDKLSRFDNPCVKFSELLAEVLTVTSNREKIINEIMQNHYFFYIFIFSASSLHSALPHSPCVSHVHCHARVQ